MAAADAATVWLPDPPEAGPASRFFHAAELAGEPVPTRRWLVDGLVPSRTVTLLGGDGGTGKSLLAMQLSVAVATGGRWLNQAVEPGRALYLSAEDDCDELHRRVFSITAAEGLSLADMNRLTIRSLAGEDALLAHAEHSGALVPSSLFLEIDARMAEETPSLAIIDTLADIFPGNENDRAQARQFIGMLRGLAIRHECAILVLAHPSLSGLSSGSGTSGSTAWSNSVRSRLYLERIVQDAYEADPDARRLVVRKANYGRVGSEIAMRWYDGVFVADGPTTSLERSIASRTAERVFLKLLMSMTEQGRYVSASPGPTFAPAVFASHPEAEGVTKRAFRVAMEALFAANRIATGRHGTGSKARTHIMLIEAQP